MLPTPNAFGGSDRYRARITGPSVYGWEAIDPRFDATQSDYAAEPHRFGYIIEVDPHDPNRLRASTPHSGGSSTKARTSASMPTARLRPTWVMTSASNISTSSWPGRSTAAVIQRLRGGTISQLLTDGDLYVARFSGTQRPGNDNLGQGAWVPLTLNGKSAVPGMTHEEVLVFTSLAADRVRPRRWIAARMSSPVPRTGKVYVACTNNRDRGDDGEPGPDAANPRGANKNGHVIEITERDDRVDATSFAWDLFLVCGSTPTKRAATSEVGRAQSRRFLVPTTSPSIQLETCGSPPMVHPASISKADGLFRVPLEGAERGRLVQFLAVPYQAETCGPVIHDRDGSVFVAVQHPGEEGSWDDAAVVLSRLSSG